MTRSGWIISGAALLCMVLLGVVAGKGFLAWRASRMHAEHLGKLHRGELSDLRPGNSFPEVDLVGPGGTRTTTKDLMQEEEDFLVVFLSPGCEGCTEAVLLWNAHPDSGEGKPRVVGIAGADAAEVDLYVRQTDLRFPVYADEADAFGNRYQVRAIPTVMGVRAGRISFIRHGIAEDFTPARAESLLDASS